MSYYLGLSFLSNNEERQKTLSSLEARRILSVFENGEIKENDISREEQGRPFFLNREVDFNITHSGDAVAVLYISKKDIRVGCDIEKIRPRSRIAKIAKDKFSKAENSFLYSSGGFNDNDFLKIWTLKESYIKLRGLSVFDMAKIPSFIDEIHGTNEYVFSFCADVNRPITFRLYEILYNENTSYILAEAIEGEDIQPEIRMFSSLTFDCKIIAEIKAAPSPAQTVNPNK
jgi:phosphopantetheinyl transferase